MSQGTWGEWVSNRGLDLELPEGWAGRVFSPTPKDQAAAWELYTELATRITTQPLHARSGDEGTALTSVYDLFKLCRELIKKHGPECNHFADLCRVMLNREIRPFTARWHKRRVAGELEIDDVRQEFRAQLERLRRKLSEYEQAMRALANPQETAPQPIVLTELVEVPDIVIPQQLLGVRGENAQAMRASERTWIEQRRKRAGGHLPPAEAASEKAMGFGFVGLALSGGGIRSATFCLGVLQALARRGVLKDVDYLSTVSGGGYIGSLMTTALAGPQPSAPTLDRLLARDGKDVSGLRERSFHHLLGKRELERILNVVLMMLQGLLTSVALITLLLIAPVALFGLVLYSADATTFLRGGYWGAIAIFWCFYLPFLVIPRKEVGSSTITAILARSFLLFSGALIAVGLTFQLRAVSGAIHWHSAWIEYGGLALTLLGAATSAFGGPKWLVRALVAVLPVLLPFTLLWFALGVAQRIHFERSGPTLFFLFIAVCSYAALIAKFANVNRVSPFRLYRQGLCETYLQADERRTAIPRLSELRDDTAAPYPLINASLNVPASKTGILRGRKSDFFVFSPKWCGSVATGYRGTTAFEALDESLDLGTAMSISAAAASSHMGMVTKKNVSPLLALFNVRLGYWLRNPEKPQLGDLGAGLLWKEITGNIDESAALLNLSDGGHIENLGLYELLRRQCRFIIAVDGEADEAITCAALLKCKSLAYVDLGVDIEIDISDFETDFEGRTRSHFALGRILYPATKTSNSGEHESVEPTVGYILYVKSSITGDEDAAVLDYRRRHPTFPHESTADQFYTEERFEAYRMLGEHIGDRLFRSEILEKRSLKTDSKNLDIREWLEALRRTLLQDDSIEWRHDREQGGG